MKKLWAISDNTILVLVPKLYEDLALKIHKFDLKLISSKSKLVWKPPVFEKLNVNINLVLIKVSVWKLEVEAAGKLNFSVC